MYSQLMSDPMVVRHFMFAGNATFTLVSKHTGSRFTYRCANGHQNDNVTFVRIRTSGDHWTFIGTIFNQTRYVHSCKTKVTEDAASVIAFNWFLRHIKQDVLPATVEFWHEGRCGKCNRQLTDPESIKRGIGPICANEKPHGGIDNGPYQRTNQETDGLYWRFTTQEDLNIFKNYRITHTRE
jgi:hypothetical protein